MDSFHGTVNVAKKFWRPKSFGSDVLQEEEHDNENEEYQRGVALYLAKRSNRTASTSQRRN